MEKSRYTEKIYELQDNIRVKYPQAIQTGETSIERDKNDFEKANSQPKVTNEEGKSFYPIKIGDTVYNDRKEGGDALKMAIGSNIGKLAEGKTVEVGEYRGLKLSILFDSFTKRTKACLEGEKHHYCELNPETDIGNIIRLDNCINNLEKEIQQLQENVDTVKSELEQMKRDVEQPFPLADELFNAETRLEEVHEALTKFELSDDTAHKEMYERLCETFPNIFSGECSAMRFEAGEGWDTLSVELHGDVFSIAHTYEQNGDLMYDPLIYFKVDYDKEKVIPISYENSGLGVYESFDIDAEPTPDSVKRQNDILDFTDEWLDNIERQGYEPVVTDAAVEEIETEDEIERQNTQQYAI